jgi:hypothetical protein
MLVPEAGQREPESHGPESKGDSYGTEAGGKEIAAEARCLILGSEAVAAACVAPARWSSLVEAEPAVTEAEARIGEWNVGELRPAGAVACWAVPAKVAG